MKSETASFYRYFPISQRDKNWGLYATTAGELWVAPHTVYPPKGHPKGFDFDWQHGRSLEGFAIVYISSGGGKFESKPNLCISLEAGHAFLLFPGVWHRYTPAPETGWREHWIGFDGEMAYRWLRHKFISAKNPVVKIGAEDTVLATFKRMMQAIRAYRPALQQILSGTTSNLISLFYSAQQSQPATDAQSANAIESAITRIQNEFDRDLNIKLLAQEAGVSYSHVTYLFRKGRPTIAMREREECSYWLCALCLHPIGYYGDTWAGVMCPTDEVIAHLLMMRGSEEKFWANANQHPIDHPAAGV